MITKVGRNLIINLKYKHMCHAGTYEDILLLFFTVNYTVTLYL